MAVRPLGGPRNGASNSRFLAEADLVEEFEIETGALFDALGFDQLVVPGEEINALEKFFLIASMARSTVPRGVT